ncbi:MAG: protein translocase subunit SecD [Spirochaetales bacterium]|nr:protein translocase subunit SecD [Spirochaetales bacterium]
MSIRARVIILVILVVMGIMFISPSVQWYFLLPDETKNIAMSSLPQIKNYAQDQAQRDYTTMNDFVNNPSSGLAAAFGGFLTKVFEEKGQVNPVAFRSAVEGQYRDDILNIKNLRDLTLQLGLDLRGGLYASIAADFGALEKQIAEKNKGQENAATLQIDKDKVLQDVMERLLARLDEFGTVEPTIRRQIGTDTIIIELPGAADPERIKKVIMGKGRLNFHLVDEAGWNKFNEYFQQHPEWTPQFNTDFTVDVPAAVGLDPGSEVVGTYQKDKYGMDEFVKYIVIKSKPELSGEAITDARAEQNPQDRSAEVTFILGNYTDKDGTVVNGPDKFADLTGKNIGKYIAVVLDNKVMSYAGIREKIPNGQVRVTGQFSMQDAQDLAKVLRSGALPVPLEIRDVAAVGASAGEDTIAKGLNAMLIGAGLVLLFILIYYKGSGVFAAIALIFNIFLLLALLSVTRFTLSLTSLAGIVLTIGMAVDANVLINERMKEELRLGKSPKAAVKAGFDRAFWTILDSNVTTFIAGIVLAMFTKGSVQGFAFTLCIGIVTSFFSAIFVSRILFDFTTDVLKVKKLSISWRRFQ